MHRFALTSCVLVGTFLVATPGQAQDRAWVDVNFGVARAAESEFSNDEVFTQFFERAEASVDYSLPTGANFDFGGGYMFTPQFGAGASFSGTAHRETALLFASIPHPTIANRFGSDEAETEEELERSESGLHLQAMFVALSSDRQRVRVFGGPSYFRVRQDVVSDFRYNQVFNNLGGNAITITEFDSEERDDSAWGFHVGADYSYFFTPVVGIGGIFRLSRATVELEGINELFETRAGGVQFGGGLRLRF